MALDNINYKSLSEPSSSNATDIGINIRTQKRIDNQIISKRQENLEEAMKSFGFDLDSNSKKIVMAPSGFKLIWTGFIPGLYAIFTRPRQINPYLISNSYDEGFKFLTYPQWDLNPSLKSIDNAYRNSRTSEFYILE